jgi:hypothetical protein
MPARYRIVVDGDVAVIVPAEHDWLFAELVPSA